MSNDERSTRNNNNDNNKVETQKNLYNNDSTEDIVKNISKLKKETTVDYAAKYKDRINNNIEEKQLIKKMQEMEEKNDKRNSAVMVITFIIIGIIVIWLLIKTFSTPLASLLGEKKKNNLDKNTTPITDTNPTVDDKKPKEVEDSSVYSYCLAKENMEKVYKQSVLVNNNDSKGITAIFVSEVLRQNGYDVPNEISNTKLLAAKLQSLGWKKHTKPQELEKGDIAFTTEMTGMAGYPSHVYVFMGWVQPDNTNDGLVCDSLKDANGGEWVHKRNISYETEQKQKMYFFMKPPVAASK